MKYKKTKNNQANNDVRREKPETDITKRLLEAAEI